MSWLILLIVLTILYKTVLSKKWKLRCYFHFYYVCVSLTALFMLPYCLIRLRNVKNMMGIWVGGVIITRLLGIKWTVRRKEILEEQRGAIVLANHQTSLDVLGISQLVPIAKKITVVVKKELLYAFPFNISAYLSGIVFVDRKKSGAVEAMKKTSNVMIRDKTKIFVFPEGTRNSNPSRMLPFKKGAFLMAVSAQVPIIPVVYSPYYFINKKTHMFQSGEIIIQCLEPIPTSGLTEEDVPALIEEIHTIMEEEYRKLTKEVLAKLPPDYPHCYGADK